VEQSVPSSSLVCWFFFPIAVFVCFVGFDGAGVGAKESTDSLSVLLLRFFFREDFPDILIVSSKSSSLLFFLTFVVSGLSDSVSEED
jgi:hypothetical protein